MDDIQLPMVDECSSAPWTYTRGVGTGEEEPEGRSASGRAPTLGYLIEWRERVEREGVVHPLRGRSVVQDTR